jgi:hypothetical protein
MRNKMTFTITDFQDLVHLLTERPEWRVQLRQALFNEHEPASRDAIDRLAEQVRLLTEQVRLLTERMDRQEQRIDRLEQRINQFEQRVDERFNQVDRNIQKLTDQVGALRGESLESRYRNHIGNFLGRVLRRVRVVEIRTIEEELETRLSDEAFDALLNLDVLATGKVKHHLNRPDVWVAIEISATINTNDVTRARQRADILCQAGYPTIAVAGGEECSLDAIALAQQTNVVIIQDGGQITGWDAAFSIIEPMITE